MATRSSRGCAVMRYNPMANNATVAGRVTILLSTYNGSGYLQQQLESLYRQSYPDIAILVRDDGSADLTRTILESEQAKGRIELLAGNVNLGAAWSFFKLLKHAAATGAEYIAFCDQDDVWAPDKIARAVSALSPVAAGTPAMYCARLELVDEVLGHIAYSQLPRKTGFGNALVESIAVGCTILLNRQAVDLIVKNLPERVVIHDWWCYLVVSCFGKVVFDDTVSIKYRQHGANAIGAASDWKERLSRKCRRFFGAGDGHRWMSEQASSFKSIFQNAIPAAEQRTLSEFVGAKSSLPQRFLLALSGAIWRQRRTDDALLRLLILMNRY